MRAGWVGILSAELHFPEAHSLKEKRMFVRSAKEQLRNRFGASVAEVDHHDVWQRARIMAAFVAREHGEATKLLADAERLPRLPRVGARARGARARHARGVGATVAQMSERMRRVNESLRQVLSEALLELKDPRIGFVTVTGVETSSDLRQATVWVSVLGSEKKRSASMTGLEAAHGVLQARLSRAAAEADSAALVCVRSRGRARRADVPTHR